MATCSPMVIFLSIVVGCHSSLVTGQITTEECTSNFDGLSINGQCFFVKTEASSWSDAWTKCAVNGATLAQVHASNEFEAIKTMLENKGRDPNDPGHIRAWIALQRDGAGGCSVTPTTTFWYDGPTKKNVNMPAGNTWVRSRQCDDQNMGGEYYMSLMMNDGVWLGVADLPDAGDTNVAYPLCQMSICNRKFTKDTKNECLDETPIESTSVIQDGFQDCAEVCSRKLWCRSFDLIPSTSTCKLFTWIASDTMKPTVKNAGSDCVHYDIDP